jgi:alkylation response protein AidB-like acyl-CoA dehydrogenase
MLARINPELKPFDELATSFAEKELSKKTEEHDRYPFGPFFSGVLEKAHEVGLLGVTLPEALGGIGQGISTLCLMLDRICQEDGSLGGIIFTSSLAQEIMLAAGADDLLKNILTDAKKPGEFLIACCSFCNPDEIQKIPNARKNGTAYRLNGELEYLVLGGLASHALIPARIDGSKKYSFFLLDLTNKGARRSEPIMSLGLHACPAVDLDLDDARGTLVGEEGKGRTYFQKVTRKMHAASAAMSTGIMKGSFREALAYSKERSQGGKEIINWSEVSMILANMAVKVNVADLCVAQACQAIEKNSRLWESQCLSAALLIQDMACDLTTDGVQMLGGNGYMKDYGQEKRYRDAKQVQALMGIPPFKKLSLIKDLASEQHPV